MNLFSGHFSPLNQQLFVPRSEKKINVGKTHLFSVCLCQHRHVLTSDQGWTLHVSWHLLGLYSRSGQQGSGLCRTCAAAICLVRNMYCTCKNTDECMQYDKHRQKHTGAHMFIHIHINIFSHKFRNINLWVLGS